MIYRILGELIIGPEEQPLPLPTGHRLTVLANLVINANRRVSTGDLLRASWGTADIDETQLHKCVSHLRNLLATIGRRSDLRTWSRYGYELLVPEDQVDKLVFERLIREADTANAARRTDEEIFLLRGALKLWRGQHPLAGVPTDAFRRELADLEQRRKRAAVRLFDLELARGRRAQILDELHRMVGYHPTDRRLCEQLMVALYRSGHATEALTAYDRHQEALAEETAAEPEARLRELMYAVARGDEQIIQGYEPTAEDHGTATIATVVPRQLRPDPVDFVGRATQAQEATWLLTLEVTANPVVVVTGAPGIGKSAFALHVAHQVKRDFPGGQLHVELHGSTPDPVPTEEVLAQVLRAFGVATVPDSRDERASLYRTLLADRPVLLLLDDARDEAQVRDLIPSNPACRVLITARERMPGIEGVHHLPTLQPLEIADAIELFERIVRRSGVDPRGESYANRRVAELCAGLPLALCIAGALRGRDRQRTTAELADQLARHSIGWLVYNDRSVESSIGAGFDRLEPDAQHLFLGLGLLQLPDFGEWTAAAVLEGTGADPVEALYRLTSSHMIELVDSPMRYRFHDLTREYARRRAERETPDPAVRLARQRHAYGALLTLTRRAHRGLIGGDYEVVHGDTPDWPAPRKVLDDLDRHVLDWYEAERRNIRAAVRHTAELGLVELCWDLAVSTHEFYTRRGYVDDWYATHTAALTACRTAKNLRGEAAVITMLGQSALVTSRRTGTPTPDHLAQAVTTFAQYGDRHGQAIALRTLASELRRRGGFTEALAKMAQAVELYQAVGDPVGRWQSLRIIGQMRLELGHPDDALHVLRRAEEAALDTRNPRLLAQTALWIGMTQLARRELAEARQSLRYVLDLVDDTDHTGRAHANYGLGELSLHTGELDEAELYLMTASELASRAPDALLDGRIHHCLADVRRAQGRPADEIAELRTAVARFGSRRAMFRQANALMALSDAHDRQGAADEARDAAASARALYDQMRAS